MHEEPRVLCIDVDALSLEEHLCAVGTCVSTTVTLAVGSVYCVWGLVTFPCCLPQHVRGSPSLIPALPFPSPPAPGRPRPREEGCWEGVTRSWGPGPAAAVTAQPHPRPPEWWGPGGAGSRHSADARSGTEALSPRPWLAVLEGGAGWQPFPAPRRAVVRQSLSSSAPSPAGPVISCLCPWRWEERGDTRAGAHIRGGGSEAGAGDRVRSHPAAPVPSPPPSGLPWPRVWSGAA